MSNETFKEIIKNTYNFEDNEENEKTCTLCGESIGDFVDYNNIYGGEYCESCFIEAQESRLL